MFVQVPRPTTMALLMIRPWFIDPRAKATSVRPRALRPSHLIVHQHLPGRHACRKEGDVFDHASTPLQHNCGGKRSCLSFDISTFACSQPAIVSVELRTTRLLPSHYSYAIIAGKSMSLTTTRFWY